MKGSSTSGRTLGRAVWLLVMAVCLTWQQKQQASTTAAQWLDPAAAAAHHVCCLQALMTRLVVPRTSTWLPASGALNWRRLQRAIPSAAAASKVARQQQQQQHIHDAVFVW